MYFLTRFNAKTIISIALAIVPVITIFYILLESLFPEPVIMYWELTENNVSCHNLRAGDALPMAEDPNFIPPENSIFFLETACKGGLNSRQACAVESAARTHPERLIYVLFCGPVTNFVLKMSCLAKLRQYGNIRLLRLHILEFTKGTPLEALVASGILNESEWRVEHSSDILRYLALYKWGGVYLDTDVVVVRSLDALGSNWVGWENIHSASSGAMALSKDPLGRKIVEAVVNEVATTFRPDVWANNGPGALTRVLEKICTSTDPNDWSADSCDGLNVYGPDYLYPIPYEYHERFFEPKELNEVESMSKAYTYHLWNYFTRNLRVKENYLYAKLAKKFCPTIYEMYGEKFGV